MPEGSTAELTGKGGGAAVLPAGVSTSASSSSQPAPPAAPTEGDEAEEEGAEAALRCGLRRVRELRLVKGFANGAFGAACSAFGSVCVSEACVSVEGTPPCGCKANRCVVPLPLLTASQRESRLQLSDCTAAPVTPRTSLYRCVYVGGRGAGGTDEAAAATCAGVGVMSHT